jgi:hypothetical protein
MKEFWIQIEDYVTEKRKLEKIATEIGDAVLYGESVLFSNKETVTVLNELDETAIREWKHQGKKIVLRVRIESKEDENNAVRAAELGIDFVIINCLDWRVIPLENLIARVRGRSKLIAE